MSGLEREVPRMSLAYGIIALISLCMVGMAAFGVRFGIYL